MGNESSRNTANIVSTINPKQLDWYIINGYIRITSLAFDLKIPIDITQIVYSYYHIPISIQIDQDVIQVLKNGTTLVMLYLDYQIHAHYFVIYNILCYDLYS